MWIQGGVKRVLGVIQQNFAGDDSIQRVRAADAAERQKTEQVLRSSGQRNQRRDVVRVGRAHSLAISETARRQWIRGIDAEPLAGLRIVWQALQLRLGNVQNLAGDESTLAGLVGWKLVPIDPQTGREESIERARV